MKCSWNRGSRQRQHINIFFQLLDFLFMGNAKALLLINDQKPQISVFHILGKHSVGSDHNIHLTLFQILNRLFLLGRGTETTQKIHPYRKFLHSLEKRIIYLLGKNRCRHKINYLAAFLYRFKCGTKSNLCFAIADVTAHQTIHNFGTFHIALGIFNCIQLILSLLVREHFLELTLPYCIWSAHISFFFLAYCIKLNQLLCNIFYCALHLGFGTVPFLCSKLIQLWCFGSICP